MDRSPEIDFNSGDGILDLFNVNREETSDEIIKEQDASVFNILQSVEAELKNDTFVTKDLAVDDSTCKESPNFFDWVLGKSFLNDSPYLEQALIGIKLFAEYCPRCSDLEWMRDENHVPQEGMDGIRKHVQMLRYGKCPKCNSKRSALFKSGELNYYNELAVNAGQRCLTGDSIVYTDEGMVKLDTFNVIPGNNWRTSVFRTSSRDIATNTHVMTGVKRVWKNDPTCLITVVLSDGTRLRGTQEHPIYLKSGHYATFKTLSPGLELDKYYGLNCSGLIEPHSRHTAKAEDYFRASLSSQKEFLFHNPDLDFDVIRLANNLGYEVVFDTDIPIDEVGKDYELKFVRGGTKVITIVDVFESEPEVTYDFCCENHRFLSDGLLQHNSGKSFLVAFLCTYIVHRLLKLQKPYRVFKINRQTILHGTFTAINSGQAKDTLWDPFYGFIAGSPWFKKYHALLDDYQRKTGKTLYKFMDTYLLYRHRNLMFNFVGPDKRALRGRSRVYASTDEIGWFDNDAGSGKVKINGSEIYIALERSLRTVRNAENWQLRHNFDRAMTGYMLSISSPSNARDKICELVRLSQGSKKSLGLHKPTWEMNPEITREDLAEEFRKDPVTSERDYGANPPLSSNPFIAAKAAAFACFRQKGRNLVQIAYKRKQHSDETMTRWAEITRIKEDTLPSVMTLDAGETNNSFSICVGHIDTKTNVPTVDILLEIQPLPGISLDYNRIYTNLLVPICRKRNVRVVISDRWNSTKILQDLEADVESVEYTKKYSLKYADMWNVKTSIEAAEISFPRLSVKSPDEILNFNIDDYPHCFAHKPTDHLFLQLLTVKDTGRTVLKGEDLTDDSWRTVCLFDWATLQEEWTDVLTQTPEEQRKRFGDKIASVGGALKKLRKASNTSSGIGALGGRR